MYLNLLSLCRSNSLEAVVSRWKESEREQVLKIEEAGGDATWQIAEAVGGLLDAATAECSLTTSTSPTRTHQATMAESGKSM